MNINTLLPNGSHPSIAHEPTVVIPPDPRYPLFQQALADYWMKVNGPHSEMPWQARDQSALHHFLFAQPSIDDVSFRLILSLRANRIEPYERKDRVFLWLHSLRMPRTEGGEK